jgi:membrane protein DedA with SNARE-associated domain
MFTDFSHLVAEASGWAYLIVLAFAVIDALLPIVPSEASVITAGVVAAGGDLLLPAVILAAAVGAFAGDNLAYLLGSRFGGRVQDRFLGGEKAQRRVRWAQRQLNERGGEMVVVARFIPGGRTAVTLSAGTLGYPWRRFATFDAIAAAVWALYASLLGYFGGRAFEDEPWKGLILAFAIALAAAATVELIRWLRHRSARSR